MPADLSLLAAEWAAQPDVDYHALAPEIVLVGAGLLLILLDVIQLDKARRFIPALAGLGLLGALIPILTLAHDGADRAMFGGAYVVDNYALVLKALFLVTGYVVVLLSTNYVAEGDYWENEYYELLLASIMGMVVMASARDLITIFVALELLSIPAYMLATWRKRDPKSNEAGLKYYLMGVFASAIMLYGMSLLFGYSGSTLLSEIGTSINGPADSPPIITLGVIFVIVGFGFKVSSVPFHTWAPDVYEGAPTPVTAFLAVASKAAGFVALMNLVFIGFAGRDDVYEPIFWILAAGSMTVGNLIALRQTNIVRLMAYSGIAQAGYIIAPLAVASDVGDDALQAMILYLIVYAAMNLGAFAVIMAVARRTRTADVDSYRGLFQYAPALTLTMTAFLFSLTGIPPFGGWYAKFAVLKVLMDANTPAGAVLAVVVAVNSVIAAFYYAGIARRMWVEDAPDGDTRPIRVPPALTAALAITVIVTLVFGVAPQVFDEMTRVTLLAGGS